MLPLLVAISLDVSLVAFSIVAQVWISVVCGCALGVLYVWMWFLYHLVLRRRSEQSAAPGGGSPC